MDMEDSCLNTPLSAFDFLEEPKDHLTALPTELQHIIIGFLYPTHQQEKAFHESTKNPPDCEVREKAACHPLDFLAATCTTLRNEIMVWSRIMLVKHSDITNYKPLKTTKLQSQRNFLRGRGGLLTWTEKHCVFCGKKSARSAVLMNGLHCCAPCDRDQWPDKITKTEAKRRYHLNDHHLLPEREFGRSLAKLLRKHPGGLPKLRYGTYISSGVATTMFLRQDVEALSILAHGDFKAHLDRKQAERDERKRKRAEAQARHQAKWDEMVGKAGEAQLEDPFAWSTSTAPDLPREPVDDVDEMRMLAEQSTFLDEIHGPGLRDDPFMGLDDFGLAF